MRWKHWVGLATVLTAGFACEDRLTAPGACPEYCPPPLIRVLDTLLFANLSGDSSFTGFVAPFEALAMPITTSDASAISHGIVRYSIFPDTVRTPAGNTGPTLAGVPDSFRLTFPTIRRDMMSTGMSVRIHRIPATIDRETTYSDLVPFFHDSTIVATIPISDNVLPDTLRATIPGNAFPSFVADTNRLSLGFSLVADAPAFLELGVLESGNPTFVTRFVSIDSAGVPVHISDTRAALVDAFVRAPLPAYNLDTVLVLGGNPTSRGIFRLNLPSRIIDTAQVVGATLHLVMVDSIRGAPNDSFRLEAAGLASDFGPKSPLLIVRDSVAPTVSPYLRPGTGDTISVDITALLVAWQNDSLLPRAVVLRASTPDPIDSSGVFLIEGTTLGSVAVGSTRSVTAIPFLKIIYVPPFSFQGN